MDPNMRGQEQLFGMAGAVLTAVAIFCLTKILVTTLHALFFEGTAKTAERLRTIWLPIFVSLATLAFAAHYAAHHPLS